MRYIYTILPVLNVMGLICTNGRVRTFQERMTDAQAAARSLWQLTLLKDARVQRIKVQKVDSKLWNGNVQAP